MVLSMPDRYWPADLAVLTESLFAKAGCDDDKPKILARCLLEADLMGHTTHGLALAAPYLEEIASDAMKVSGSLETVSDRGAALCWDGKRLPGVWLISKAVDLCVERAKALGTATIAIRRSHHAACLAVYLEQATSRGMIVLIVSSDPSAASVAPFGGLKAVFTPDPIAVGIPTDGDPILIDMSASITTNGLTNRLRGEGKRFPGQWAMTAAGEATDDPNALFTDPPGTLLPSGGKDHGHKGYGWALTVEALSQGLSGFGRADAPEEWGASLFVQVLDPAAFGGADAFIRQTGWIAEACRDNPPAPGFNEVRLPGSQALQKKRQAMKEGVVLHASIIPSLSPWAEKFGIAMPKPRK
jgi:LDH2 family malate/lactate/ureidoglycolate dehydrogenase